MGISMTYEEYKEDLLRRMDALELLEAMNITSEDLVERFDDRVQWLRMQEEWEEMGDEYEL